MTTNKNFKSKNITNHNPRYFDIKKLLPKVKKYQKDDALDSEIHSQAPEQTPTKRSVKPQPKPVEPQSCDCTVDNLNPFYGKGRPYLLVSEDETQESKSASKPNVQRDAVCYNVLHEKGPRLDVANVAALIKGIRISICVEHTRFPLIGKISKTLGLTHVPEHRLWNIQWCDNTPHFDLLKSMKRFQQINHFPGMSEICRKDLLSRNLNRMLKMFPGDYRIFPKTWLMPTDAYDVSVYATKHKRTYILKPYSSGQGRGIWLTNNLRTIRRQEKLICQTYVDRPLLIDGYKFDLRIYILVTSVDPLRIFVYNEGLARFATHKYMPPALNNSNNVYMHLTNYCVNRHNSNYDAGSGTEGGSKRNLGSFNKWLVEHNYSADEFWASVDDAIIKTVISAWPVLKHNYHLCFPKHDKIQACFQLLGFDILVDWKLKPYILEVNHTPSLLADEAVDHEVKRPLIKDTLNLLSTPLVDKEEIIREDRAVLKDRLMRQAGRRRVASSGSTVQSDLHKTCSFGALAQQIVWEESHMGNYRRIMPPMDDEKVAYYCKFYNQTKSAPMFKDNKVSKSRLKIHLELLEQQKALQREEAEKEQKRLAKHKEKPVMVVDFEPTEIQLETQRKLEKIIAKDLRRQKLKAESKNSKSNAGLWQAVHKSRPVNTPTHMLSSSPSARLKNKRCTNIVKAYRRKQRRHIQRRARLSRRLEWESRQDAEFLERHAICQTASERLQGGNSNHLLSTSSSHRQHVINDIKKYKSKSAKPKEKLIAKPKKKLEVVNDSRPKKAKARTKTMPREINDWLPERITESEKLWQKEWRRQRSAYLNDQQFRELLFNEMYEHGHLTKNDIKLFPSLLYRILKNRTSTDTTTGEST